MMDIDVWQMLGSVAAFSFTLGFVDQLRVTFQSKNTEGLSVLQWCMFAIASAIFIGYYGHLEQWMMFAVSIFGTMCCLSVLLMMFLFRQPKDYGTEK